MHNGQRNDEPHATPRRPDHRVVVVGLGATPCDRSGAPWEEDGKAEEPDVVALPAWGILCCVPLPPELPCPSPFEPLALED